MLKAATIAGALSLAMATSALAQTTPPPAMPPASPPSASVPAPSPKTAGTESVLTDAQAKAWVDKIVYSSDDKNLGEVAAIARDASGKVVELHADIGGFLGLGEARVRIQPTQFRFDGDKVILTLTAEQAKSLPVIAKK